MNLEMDIKEKALTLMVDNSRTKKIKIKDVNTIICQGIRINKKMSYKILKSLEEDGEIIVNSQYVILKHDI